MPIHSLGINETMTCTLLLGVGNTILVAAFSFIIADFICYYCTCIHTCIWENFFKLAKKTLSEDAAIQI